MNSSSGGNLFLFLELLTRWKNFILWFVCVSVIIAIAVAMLLTPWYKAKAVLLPSRGDALPVGKYTELSEMSSLTSGLDLPALVTAADVHAKILEGQTISDRMIEQFGLKQEYPRLKQHELYEALADHAKFRVTEVGLLEITVEHPDPVKAAAMANAYSVELNRIARELLNAKARSKRIFIEERLTDVKLEVDSARQAFQRFQLSSRTVDVPRQTEMALTQASDIRSQLARLDMDIETTERTLASDHPDLKNMYKRRQTLAARMQQIERGTRDTGYLNVPLTAMPGVRDQFLQMSTRVALAESLQVILLGQLEQARIQELESTPSVAVIDSANVPTLRSRPKRTFIVAGSAILAAILAICFAGSINYLHVLRKSDPANFDRARSFVVGYFGWIPGLRKGIDAG
jgi:uncharacterized protein involved in exopolysaccharide biosynthesis